MNIRITCNTYFDITATGLRGNFSANRLPIKDRSGQDIKDERSWHIGRNQQRNWETFTQLISLRTLPVNIEEPEIDTTTHLRIWRFSFEVENPAGLADASDPLGSLKSDCQGIPMILGLTESNGLEPMVDIGANTFFSLAGK